MIPNLKGTYAMVNRSNLTFADGTPVYAGGELEGGRDGEFLVLVQVG